MLRPRIIPCLLVKDKGLVKTVKFKDPKYVGDPINAVRIFNEKEVDELMVLDIDASAENREPDYKMIENLATECRMPLCYGGGVKTVEQAQRIFSLGVEKIALSSAAVEDITIIKKIAAVVGVQSVIVVIDVKKKVFGGYEVVIYNGLKKTGKDPVKFAKELQELGAGELVINSIDNDGVMRGFDFEIIDKIRQAITIPMTVLGGAGSLDDIARVIRKHRVIGVAAGSLFVFKGIYKAVLINYPNNKDKNALFF
ncbi:AglZ/HisF2 family acetamidino modification protein [Lacihabitans sp. CS3-21]|uniref:AglZ/HisF2 family acetamidino modification protein n=1 Tax=Lacihabitans sp. CS3-21 TaxID=2487332 RepID=UPI0020CD971A|nr:AglZ/HisF2 family acetamidino modification protein [Lacihabitans sp. CS3-21]MCP9747558.1 imidazole glycerol phosphate synthase subunit HisF [Lacihabitans sp. CS3-21]